MSPLKYLSLPSISVTYLFYHPANNEGLYFSKKPARESSASGRNFSSITDDNLAYSKSSINASSC